MRDDEILSLGEGLFEALTQCRTVDPLTERHPDMTIEDAYRVQQRLIELRRDRGGRAL